MSEKKLENALRTINWWIHILQGIDSLMQDEDYTTYCGNYRVEDAISRVAQYYGCNCIWATYRQSWLTSDAHAQAHMAICKDINLLQVLKRSVVTTYGQPVSQDGTYAIYAVGSYRPHIPLRYLDESQIDSIPYKIDRSTCQKRNAIDYMIDKMTCLQYEQITIADIERSYNVLVQAVADVKVDSGTGATGGSEDKERALTGE
jgi:hypothetical protein